MARSEPGAAEWATAGEHWPVMSCWRQSGQVGAPWSWGADTQARSGQGEETSQPARGGARALGPHRGQAAPGQWPSQALDASVLSVSFHKGGAFSFQGSPPFSEREPHPSLSRWGRNPLWLQAGVCPYPVRPGPQGGLLTLAESVCFLEASKVPGCSVKAVTAPQVGEGPGFGLSAGLCPVGQCVAGRRRFGREG